MHGHAPARPAGLLLSLLPILAWGLCPATLGGGEAVAVSAAAETLAASGAATAPIRGSRPATVNIPLSAALRAALGQAAVNAAGAAGAAPTVRLLVEGIEPPAGAAPTPAAPAAPANSAIGVRVFLGAPEASAATPLDDPHYAGSFALYGRGGGPTAPARTSFVLDLGRTLRALGPPDRWLHGGELPVTLVAVPLRHGEKIDDVAVPFEKVSLSLHPRP
jgi:hypothetical protein